MLNSTGADKIIRAYLDTFHQYQSELPVKTPYDFVRHLSMLLTDGVELDAPLKVSWQVTNACNLRCKYCSASANASVDPASLNTEEAFRLIDQLSDLRVLEVNILGGEPFVRKDMVAILERLMQRNIIVKMATNGTLITQETASNLKQVLKPGYYFIQVSLDGPDPESNDVYRGHGTFRRVLKGCEHLSQHGIEFSINSVVTRMNYHRMLDMYRLAARLGASGFSVFRVLGVGRGVGIPAPSELEMLDLALRLKQVEKDMGGCQLSTVRPGYLQNIPGYPQIVREHFCGRSTLDVDGFPLHCTAARSSLDIDSDGTIHPCVFLRFPEFALGNVKTTPIATAWRSSLAQYLRTISRRDKDGCKSCDLKWCNTGCMGIAYERTGRLLAKDPHCEYVPN